MQLKDRLLRGFTAGVVGGITMNVVSLISYYLGLAELRLLDWSALAIYGLRPTSFTETGFAFLAHLVFSGILGIIFAYLITIVTSINHLFRGAVFGAGTWFALYGISMLFQLEATTPLHVDTAATDFVASLVYGLVMAETLRRLDERIKT